MLKLHLEGGEKLAEAIKNKPSTLLSVLSVRLNQLMIQLANYVTFQKLSGQVLKRQTGKLADSVHPIPASIAGQKVAGYVEAAGPSAPYGVTHEHGGSRAYEIFAVRAKALHFVMDGREVFAKRVMHPPAIARPFMSTSLTENKANIVAELQNAINEVLAKK